MKPDFLDGEVGDVARRPGAQAKERFQHKNRSKLTPAPKQRHEAIQYH